MSLNFVVFLVCVSVIGDVQAIDDSMGCRHLTNLLEDLPHRIKTVQFNGDDVEQLVVNVSCMSDPTDSSAVSWCWLFNDARCSCNETNTAYAGSSIKWQIPSSEQPRYDGTVLGCFRSTRLIEAFYASGIAMTNTGSDEQRPVVIGVSITLGLVTTFLFIAPCFALSYWSSRQATRPRPGLPHSKRGSRLSSIGFHTVRTIKEQNIERITTLGKGGFGGDICKAKVKDITPSDPKKIFACVKIYEGNFDRTTIQQQIDFRKNLKSHENLTNFLGCFIGGKKMILVVELGWYGSLLPFLEEKSRAIYLNTDTTWNKLGDFDDIHERTAHVDCETNGLESIISSEDYQRAFLGPMRERLSEDNMLIFALQIALALEHLSKCACVHKGLTCESVYIASNFGLKVGGFDADMDQPVHVNEMTDGPLLQKKTASNRLLAKWSPPEAIESLNFSQSSDVWSFGMTIWELASYGCVPWEDLRLNGLVKHLNEGAVPAQPNGCSDTLYAVMKKCWVKDADDRPGINTIARDLKRLVRVDSEPPMGHDKRRRSTLPMIDSSLTTVHEEEDNVSIN
jgi:serine/threonine protein kinase